MVFSIFSHSGYITDTFDLSGDIFQFINPNTASYEDLARIPFLSDREISLIITERQKSPFKSLDDMSHRIGLLPFETAYLDNIFYFRKHHNVHFYFRLDSTISYKISAYAKNKPIFAIWNRDNSTYFMNAVHTQYVSFYQGYITPFFKGGLFEQSSFARRRDGLKRDTIYNIGFIGEYLLFFHSPEQNLMRASYKTLAIIYRQSKDTAENNAFTFSVRHNNMFARLGVIGEMPVFYASILKEKSSYTAFADVYSKYYSSYRVYGAHIYSRRTLSKRLSIKTSAAYKHTYKGYMRLSTTLHLHIPEFSVFCNTGIKKTYYDRTRFYISAGRYGRNYVYVSLTKTLKTPSYLIRYSMSAHGLFISYILSVGDEEYLFLDDTGDGYFLGTLTERLRIGYRAGYKSIHVKITYEKDRQGYTLRLQAYGRISY